MALKHYDIDGGKPFTYWHDLLEGHLVTIGSQKFSFPNESEARLLYEAYEFFGPGEYVLPDTEEDARQALEDWVAHKAELGQWFQKRSDDYSADDKYVEKMVREYWNLYRQYRRGLEDPPGARKSPVHKVKVERSPGGEAVPIVFGPIPRGKYETPPIESPETTEAVA